MSRTGLRVATSKVVTVDSTNKEELQLAAGVELTDGDSIVIEAEGQPVQPAQRGASRHQRISAHRDLVLDDEATL